MAKLIGKSDVRTTLNVSTPSYDGFLSPTVFTEGPFRVHFFSLEESRLHVHVTTVAGEAKIWVEPEIELARSKGLSEQDLNRAIKLVNERQQEIREAWNEHFAS